MRRTRGGPVTGLALTAALAVVLAGCGGTAGQSASPAAAPSASAAESARPSEEVSGTLTGLFFVSFKDTYEKIVAKFKEKYPNVDVKFDYQGGDFGPLVLTQIQAGTAPDILTSFPGGSEKDSTDNVVPLAAQGHIAPLTADWGAQIPKLWKPDVSYKDQVYAYPGALQPLSAIYNQTKLDELGLKVPTTLDEVYQLCADAKAKGVYAYAQGLGDAAAGPQMLSFGQTATLVYGPDPTFDQKIESGETTYAKSPWLEQFKIYDKMFKDRCFGEGSLGRSRDQGATAVATGQALGIVDVGAVLSTVKTQSPSTKFVVGPIPATNDGKTYVTALPGFVTTINSKAKNPAAAQAFLQFMGEPEPSLIYAEGFQSVPVIPNAQYTPPAELAAFAQLVADGKFARIASVQAEVQTALNQYLQSMFLGKDTPESVAQKMQDAHK
jgi:raffinose/stachyose/melibiose transport system substrate-binding protein